MIGRRLVRWRCSVRLPWRLARRRAALLAGAPASQRMQDEQFRRICGRALPFTLCVGRACGLCALPWRFFCAGGRGGGCFSRPSAARPAPSPPVSPPFRRPRAWSCRCWAWGGGGATPAPAGRLRVGGLGGLAAGRALSCVPSAGWRPASRPVSRPRRASGRGRGRFRGVWLAGGWGAAVLFRVGSFPFPRRARGALPPSPRRAPPSGSHPGGNYSGGRGTTSRVLLPLVAVGCAQRRAPCRRRFRWRLSSRPAAVRAPLAAPCAPSAPFGARRPRRLVVRFGR